MAYRRALVIIRLLNRPLPGLSPAAGRASPRAGHRRRADGPSARGPGQQPARGAAQLSLGARWARRAPRRGHGTVLTMRATTAVSYSCPWGGIRLPARQRSVSAITIRQPCQPATISSRPYPRMPGRPSLGYWMVGRRRDVAETARVTLPSEAGSRMPRRCGSSSGGQKQRSPRPGPNWPRSSSPPTAITASSPTGTGTPWIWRPTIADHAETLENVHPRPEVRRGPGQPSPLGPLQSRQRRLAGRPGDGSTTWLGWDGVRIGISAGQADR